MEYKQFGSKYFIRIDKGEEIISTITKFCNNQNITLGQISGIGAVNKVTIGLFETQKKVYKRTQLTGDFEITSLSGNISTMDGEAYLHVHVSLGNKDYNVMGGHLNEAYVSATAELIIDSIYGKVERTFSDEIGLNLFDFKK